MEVASVVDYLEKLAPLETQESWDCSGWVIELQKDVKKILLCLSVTENIVKQAKESGCKLIISHHPLFFVPFELKQGISIYSLHTNLDKASGGTTDSLIRALKFNHFSSVGDFVRLVELDSPILLDDFIHLIKSSIDVKKMRVVNNLDVKEFSKIAFCAGSGMDLLDDALCAGAEVFVTGDVKYHPALESNVIIIDVGHFESERPVLSVLAEKIAKQGFEVLVADEKSPFIYY